MGNLKIKTGAIKTHTKKQKWVAWAIFIIALLLTLLLEVMFVKPHGHFGLDGTRFFYALYGFIACAIIIIVSKMLGIFLKRKDGYYMDIERSGK